MQMAGCVAEGGIFTDRHGSGIRRILANVRSKREKVVWLLLLKERSASQSHLVHNLVRRGAIRGLYSLRVRHAQEH
jgi:hypothetical protein